MCRIAKVLVERGAVVLCCALVATCTVVKLDKNQSAGGDEYSAWTKTGTAFQADKYVAAIWEKRVLPDFEKNALDVGTVLAALKANRKEAIAKYGIRKETGEVVYLFKVRGEAKVVKYDNTSRNGVIRMNILPEGSEISATLQVGPVIVGTAIRDSLAFIRFSDIGNQLQFADLANQLNERMLKDSVANLDLPSLAGKRISFSGCFSLQEDQDVGGIVVTPVTIERVDASGAGK
jgi:predicted lipoprotein